MARQHRPNPAKGSTATEEMDDKPSLQGGSLGVPVQVNTNPVLAPVREPRETEKVTQQYRVVNGGMVMYDGCRVAIRAGKLVDETTHNLDLLKRQGIILETIKSNEPPKAESLQPDAPPLPAT